MSRLIALLLFASLAVAGCGGSPTGPTVPPSAGGSGDTPPPPPPTPTPPPPTPTPPPAPPPPAPAPPPPPSPTLAATRFLAFGDSMTAGYIAVTPTSRRYALPDAYPTKLEQLLRARYPTQPFTIGNEGKLGEWASDGQFRLPPILRAERPEVLMLMHGANDVNGLGRAGFTPALDGLENMLRDGRALGALVLLASLPPQVPGSALGGSANLIPEFNASVRRLAERQNVPFVDVNAAFAGNLQLISPDGLHPTTAGYQRIAEAFFDVIRARLERAPASISGVTPTTSR